MALTKEEKGKIIKKFAVEKGDTGSSEVQIALLNTRIKKLTKHLGKNKGDVHSRRGLLLMVAKRRRLLNYLSDRDKERYQKILKTLKLKQ